MLHDVGKLVLARNVPKQYADILKRAELDPMPLWQMEQDTFGAGHAQVGAYLLHRWSLPDPVIEAVAFHHQPMTVVDKTVSPLTAVYAANCIEQKSEMDNEYLENLGVTNKFVSWKETCDQAVRDGEQCVV